MQSFLANGQTDTTALQHVPAPIGLSGVNGTEQGSDTGSVDKGKLAIVGGSLLGGMAAVHFYQANGWWKNNRRSFHFQEDYSYALNIDKVSHFFGASVLTVIMSKSFQWADVSERNSLWLGAGAAILFQTFTEIEDGFSVWGFDRMDFTSNIGGALLPVARHYWTPLQAVDMKFSYIPSADVGRAGPLKGQTKLIVDDYQGQTYWLSFKMKKILPQPADEYWPEFLTFDFGFGARDLHEPQHYRVFFLGLGLDVTKVIPQNTPFLRTLSEMLNFIRFPAPAVRISPSAVWYGLYF